MNKKNLAVHFGFWDNKTKNLNDALINENRIISEELAIKKTDTVLDAGCGVGGSSIWIAENYGAKVTGITITRRQVELAKKYAIGRGVQDLVDFKLNDFCKTDFSSGSFDKIFAIESVCHAEDKADFLSESYRLLKPGGRLVVSDGFLIKENLSKAESSYYKDLCDGWVLPNLAKLDEFRQHLVRLGYKNIEYKNMTNKILESSRDMNKSARYILPIVGLLSKMKLISESNALAEKACIAQYNIFESKVGEYGMFIAEK